LKSICIDICPATVAEAFAVLTAQNDHDLDNYPAGYFKRPEFFEAVCPVSAARFDNKLDELVAAIARGQAPGYISKEWCLDLVEKIIFHECGNYPALNGIRSIKLEITKEILTRLKVAGQYMEAEYLSIEEINRVAVFCTMSEFHFFRSFGRHCLKINSVRFRLSFAIYHQCRGRAFKCI
jgi:hypothetical protein